MSQSLLSVSVPPQPGKVCSLHVALLLLNNSDNVCLSEFTLYVCLFFLNRELHRQKPAPTVHYQR